MGRNVYPKPLFPVLRFRKFKPEGRCHEEPFDKEASSLADVTNNNNASLSKPMSDVETLTLQLALPFRKVITSLPQLIIEYPGCVWDAKFMENGDIVTACSDGVVRIWIVDHDTVADQLEPNLYTLQHSQSKSSRYFLFICHNVLVTPLLHQFLLYFSVHIVNFLTEGLEDCNGNFEEVTSLEALKIPGLVITVSFSIVIEHKLCLQTPNICFFDWRVGLGGRETCNCSFDCIEFDGQTKVIREGDDGDGLCMKHERIELGEVVDGPEESTRPFFDGIQYDYVFDVDIGDGFPTLGLRCEGFCSKFVKYNQMMQSLENKSRRGCKLRKTKH
ncbi:hypothetical protein VNO77_16843 [Canavalia gladiata]|uniref:PFU domain-containing protein n=1 Tax=Canavalia gladiata TaxID=3824 RepID=A0AAN9LLK5_CANGL